MRIKGQDDKSAEQWRLVEDLVEVSRVDTVYGDLYRQRARELLAENLSEADYRVLKVMQTEAANLPNRLRAAMVQERWDEVKELSARLKALQRTLKEKSRLAELGEQLYARADVSIDPFSPGLRELAGVSAAGGLQAIRDREALRLARLAEADPPQRDFYAARAAALRGLRLAPSDRTGEASRQSEAQLQQQAQEALEKGNFEELEALAENLMREAPVATGAGPSRRLVQNLSDLRYEFSPATVEKARRLGLAAVRVAPGAAALKVTPELFADYSLYFWHPTFVEHPGLLDGSPGSVPLPTDTPSALKERIELFVLHPFINSGGARFLPTLVEEDLLVEDFDDPGPGSGAPRSELLAALGFEDRRGLSRVAVEKALDARGSRILGEVGLDPLRFRLICIPPDLHLRLGLQRGWGQQPLWTHFDGYMLLPDRKLMALAGGDVRFGGIFDMVGIGRDYDSDRVFARFAVVQRRRMSAWPA